VPIVRLLETHAFRPEETEILLAVFEATLRDLGLTNRTDIVTELVAEKIIYLALRGERDPARLRTQAIHSLIGDSGEQV